MLCSRASARKHRPTHLELLDQFMLTRQPLPCGRVLLFDGPSNPLDHQVCRRLLPLNGFDLHEISSICTCQHVRQVNSATFEDQECVLCCFDLSRLFQMDFSSKAKSGGRV